jgi:hypothetical protein
MLDIDFGYNWLATIRSGEQTDEPENWTAIVFSDSKAYYYEVPISWKDEFEDWVEETFSNDTFADPTDAYYIEWRD